MSMITGLALGLLIMVLGALGMTVFGMYLANREEPVRTPEAPITLTRDDAQKLVQLIENLKPLMTRLRVLIADRGSGNQTSKTGAEYSTLKYKRIFLKYIRFIYFFQEI